ncbi:Long chain acyl-CoA synthetase 6, peroxisomal like [Melia azedarach]|uniref:Long chain acyl-CoA synthetase 6, peroxisomal like n=1 Tax=Melia azedarach TaxID=155640 RepID=A0ACC1YI68_MELAZ|nr:Long chain acyl-CoA synthetase 6, peroxisomal like [Melia azedarach]
MKCPATPSTNDIPPTKLSPRPPTFKREVRSSPVQRSKRCPISEVAVGGEDEHLPLLPSTSGVKLLLYLKLLSQGHSSLQPEDIAIICCTSGTTGTPKCLKKIEDCMRELLGYVEDCANAQMSINAGRSHNDNNNATNNNNEYSWRTSSLLNLNPADFCFRTSTEF